MAHPLVVHWRQAPFDVLITRDSRWGNPFSHKPDSKAMVIVDSRSTAIKAFEEWLLTSDDVDAKWMREHLHELEGKVLGCWCAPQRCHGEVLARLANPGSEPEVIQDTLF